MPAEARTAGRRKAVALRWDVSAAAPEADAVRRLADALKIAPACARILLRRGLVDIDAAEKFLSRRMDLLHEPEQLPDIARAVQRIAAAVDKGERIVLFGDYDVDGVTSTALLTRFFRVLKRSKRARFEVEPLVPEREQGYGLSQAALARILAQKPDLVITLDNGISAHDPVAALSAAGVDCIIVDHHHVGAELPKALAVINPKRDCAYPFKELCGAGVTFKLAWALAVHYSQNKRVTPEFKAFLLDALALAATGTVADVVPLVDENRVLTHHGLTALSRTQLPGLRALLETCAIQGVPSAGDVSFRIAPRINAAGRCGKAAVALELLLTDDPVRAGELAQELDDYNAERQSIEMRILDEARAQAQQRLSDNPACRGLVLDSAQWHIGVIGIVASRIVEEFHRPALLLSVDRATNLAQGSGRSIRGLHLCEALGNSAGLLRTFGGHAAAAGLTLEAPRIAEFRRMFEQTAAQLLSDDDLQPRLRLDDYVPLAEVSQKFCQDLELFEPCGMGNPRPTLAAQAVTIPAPPKLMGKDERHLSFFARHNGTTRRVVAFNSAEHYNALCDLSATGILDIAYRPQLNTFRGETSVELILESFRAAL